MWYLDMEAESEKVKRTAQEVLESGGHFQPMIGVFEGGEYRGAVVIRPANEEDEEEDSKCAFAEACILIPFLHGDEVVVSFDAFITQVDSKTKEEKKFEAINVLIASDEAARARMLPYERDEEGNFTNWVEMEKEDDNINPSGLSGNMIGTLAHFMSFHSHLEYSKLMMKSLSKKGHVIFLPEGEQYIGGEISHLTNDELQETLQQ